MVKIKENSKDLTGGVASIEAEIIEHLRLNKKQWITIKLPNNQKITLRLEDCKVC